MLRQSTSACVITNIYQIIYNHAWANQLNHSSMASLYLYRDLLECTVGLNLMIKMFLLYQNPQLNFVGLTI